MANIMEVFMNIDCTLNTFSVPGFTGFEQGFGTKKPSGESISSREAAVNIAMPFSLMRGHTVNENSTTTEVESNRVFNITTPNITLQISEAAYNGCQAFIINSSSGPVSVLVNNTETISLFSGEITEIEFVNNAWSRRSAKQTLRSLSEFDFIADNPVAISTTNVNTTTGGNITMDGVTLSSGDRVLLKDQTDPRENGYWIVQSGLWNRDPNYATGNTTGFTNKFISPIRGSQRGRLFFLVQDRYTIGTTGLDFIDSKFSLAPIPGKVPMYDKNGLLAGSSNHADMIDGIGRDLRQVFGIDSTDPLVYVPLIMAEIRRCCNNNGEINDTGVPDFSGIEIGDYIDGISLDGIAAPIGGDATQAWNDTYKNNRITVSGFNTYKGAGDTENTQNHVLFTFRNVIARGRVNSTDVNAGGYTASELRIWLEGANGDGNATFANRLRTALGGNFLYTIRKAHSAKSVSAWNSYTVFPASELEVFGFPVRGDEGVEMAATATATARASWITNVQFPIYTKSYAYRIKRFNGARQFYWESTPHAVTSTHFCTVSGNGNATGTIASRVDGGVSPAFCVA
jgi:hypothetical protein